VVAAMDPGGAGRVARAEPRLATGPRVLHVIPSVSPLRGGPSAVIGTVAIGLAEAGLDVHVATTDDDGAARRDTAKESGAVDQGVTWWYFRRQIAFYTFSWPLNRWLARHSADYDLVHVHALFSYPSVRAAYWAGRRGVPYIVRPLGVLNRWGMEHRRRWLKWFSLRFIERRLLAGAARIHFTSDDERAEAMRLGLPQDHAVVLPMGIDLAPFRRQYGRDWLRERAPHLADRTVVLFLARLDPKKGLDLLLRAFARVLTVAPRMALVVAGAGEPRFEAALRREAVELGIERDVLWSGFLRGEAKLAALGAADIFILPSHSENFGIAVVEAMAAGVPVIISDRVGIHGEVEAAGAGVVVRCEVEAIADALQRLGADATARKLLGEQGRRLADEQYSADAMISRTLQMYREVLATAKAPRTRVRPK
jgi:glycosyltransferase involved in cell wall biosynthesis